jgi:hypothetical protein
MVKIVAYRRKSDDRIVIFNPDMFYYIYIAATPTKPTIYRTNYRTGSHSRHSGDDANIKYIDTEVNAGELEMVDLVELKWLYPHLIKSVKKQVNNYLKK